LNFSLGIPFELDIKTKFVLSVSFLVVTVVNFQLMTALGKKEDK
jgi:hypothetical protein